MNVLVVDDDRDILSLAAYVLGKGGHDVAVADTGPAALVQASESLPDAILLDAMMPGMGGEDVLIELGRDPRTASIPASANEPPSRTTSRYRTQRRYVTSRAALPQVRGRRTVCAALRLLRPPTLRPLQLPKPTDPLH